MFPAVGLSSSAVWVCASEHGEMRSCASGSVSRAPGELNYKSYYSSFSGKFLAVHTDTKLLCACPCSEGCPWDCWREVLAMGPWRPLLLLSRALCSSPPCGVNNVASLPSEALWGGVKSPWSKQAPARVWRAAPNISVGQQWSCCSVCWWIEGDRLERDRLWLVANLSKHKHLLCWDIPNWGCQLSAEVFSQKEYFFLAVVPVWVLQTLWLSVAVRGGKIQLESVLVWLQISVSQVRKSIPASGLKLTSC